MGGYQVAYVGFWSGKNGLVRRYLLHFDLSSIPAGATVLAATFEHQVLVHQPPGWGLMMTVAEVPYGNWLDTTANWAKYFCESNGSGSLLWDAPGGDFIPDDSATWYNLNAGHKEVDVTALVQRIINVDGQANLIMFMDGDTSANSDAYVKVATSEAQGGYETPHLDVSWIP